MSKQVGMGASMTCTFGSAPATLVVPPASRVTVDKVPAANVMDFKPIVNIPTFGMCTSLANPTVAAATAAALGVLTPMPCIPAPLAPWAPGSPTVTVGKMPALNDQSMCNCAYGGVIRFSTPGQMSTSVP